MPRFLSDAWIDALDVALRNDEQARRVGGSARICIGQVVTGTPHGDVRYEVRVGDGTIRVVPGIDLADVTFTQDHDTAMSIARGELGAQAAFMDGRVRIGGDLELLMEHAPALTGLDEALARARAGTTY
jgi:putative sterol carrier protein